LGRCSASIRNSVGPKGRIVMISSVAGKSGNPLWIAVHQFGNGAGRY